MAGKKKLGFMGGFGYLGFVLGGPIGAAAGALVGHLASEPPGDQLTGGRADGKKPEDFDAAALAKGVAVEAEHTDDASLTREIAMDHLEEHPGYYDALEEMEDQLEREESTGAFALALHEPQE